MNKSSSAILIVDDNPDNLNVLSDLLDSNGFEVLFALDGETALERARFAAPALILLDVMMPGIDGFQTCRSLKSNRATTDIPVIFMTALTDTVDKVKGFHVGAVDFISKPFEPEEVLARITTHLENQRLHNALKAKQRELLEKQKKLDEDLHAAAEIQRSLIPKHIPDFEPFRVAWEFHPCEQVGGDIFDFFRLDESSLAFYLLDVSGHGVPSAMVTVSVSQSLAPTTGSLVKHPIPYAPYYSISPPVEVLKGLDREYPLERFDKFFTMVYLIINTKTGEVRYSNAGHPRPVLVRANGQLDVLQEGGCMIGMDGIVPFTEGQFGMKPGDRLFLYTDGVNECSNEADEFYGEERLYQLLQRFHDEPLETQCQHVITSLREYMNGIPAEDDITLCAIEYQSH